MDDKKPAVLHISPSTESFEIIIHTRNIGGNGLARLPIKRGSGIADHCIQNNVH